MIPCFPLGLSTCMPVGLRLVFPAVQENASSLAVIPTFLDTLGQKIDKAEREKDFVALCSWIVYACSARATICLAVAGKIEREGLSSSASASCMQESMFFTHARMKY